MSGYEWLQLVKRKYKKVVWLNPKMAPGRAPWREAETAVKEMFPMYKLTVDGLNRAMVIIIAAHIAEHPFRIHPVPILALRGLVQLTVNTIVKIIGLYILIMVGLVHCLKQIVEIPGFPG